jgi:hypothetical protein
LGLSEDAKKLNREDMYFLFLGRLEIYPKVISLENFFLNFTRFPSLTSILSEFRQNGDLLFLDFYEEKI